MVKSIAAVPQDVAMDATAGETAGRLRDQVRALGKRRLGESPEMVMLRALLTRSKRLSKRRNDLLHGLWGQELDGEPVYRAEGESFGPVPAVADLESLADELAALVNEMHWERLRGFLFEALGGKKIVAPAS